jgi:hypothetical protein
MKYLLLDVKQPTINHQRETTPQPFIFKILIIQIKKKSPPPKKMLLKMAVIGT